VSTSERTQQATSTRTRDAMLLDFLREHEADCPVCGYNLKGLTRPVCPECRHELVLSVGAKRLRLGWLLLAVAPGCFSGIAALFVLVPIVGRVVFGDGALTWPLIALDLFGWLSALIMIIIAVKPERFLAQPRAIQRWWALLIWIVHITAFAVFVLFGIAYL